MKDEEVDSEMYNNDNGFHHCCLQGEREGERNRTFNKQPMKRRKSRPLVVRVEPAAIAGG